jgi:cytoskeleton protein RodZ
MPEPQQIIRPQDPQADTASENTLANNTDPVASVDTTMSANDTLAANVVDTNASSVTPPSVADTSSTPVSETTTSVVDPAPTSVLNQPSAQASENTTGNDTVSTSSEGLLTIDLTGDCWINVIDANGKVLVDGVKTASNKVEVRGTKPFKVILGAPQVASISLDGSEVSLAEFANGRVARLTLPRAQ